MHRATTAARLAGCKTPLKWLGVFFITALFLSLYVLRAQAAPITDDPLTVTQPDGAVIQIYQSGDETYHWLHDAAHYTIVRDAKTGYYVYADLVNDQLVPTQAVVGKSDPAQAGLVPNLNLSAAKVEQMRTQRAKFAAVGPKGFAPTKGTWFNLVIFVRFAGNAEFTDPLSKYEGIFNDTTTGANSLWNFYQENSYNQLTIQSDFFPAGTAIVSYQDSHPLGYYQDYIAGYNDLGYQTGDEAMNREQVLVANAINFFNASNSFYLDGGVIDRNGDGEVDNVTVIAQGSSANSQVMWPHYVRLGPDTVLIKGKKVKSYIFSATDKANTGTFAHEMGHVMGAPDFYRYGSASSSPSPLDKWELMATGRGTPMHMSCYVKFHYFGWFPDVAIYQGSGTGTFTLYPLNNYVTPALNSGNCLFFTSPNSTTEYYVAEYRRAQGTFESMLPGSGLLIYRVNEAAGGKGNAGGPPDELYLYRLNGTPVDNGDFDRAFFSAESGRTTFNDGTNPSPFLSNGSKGGLNICNVGSAGASITFNLCTGASTNTPPVIQEMDDLIFDEDFPELQIDLWPYVWDAETPDAQMSITMVASTLVNGSILNNRYLVISPKPNVCGQGGQIRFKAADAVGASDEEFFSVTVNCVDDPPFIETPISDQIVNTAPITMNLHTVGWDWEDGNGPNLDWYVTGENGKVTVIGEYSDDDILTFWPTQAGAGNAVVTLHLRDSAGQEFTQSLFLGWSSYTPIAPNAFNKLSPHNITTADTRPLLTWQPSSSPVTRYEVCVGLGICPKWIDVGLNTFYRPELMPNTSYYWQVRAYNGDLGPTTSPDGMWFFTTGPRKLLLPSVLRP